MFRNLKSRLILAMVGLAAGSILIVGLLVNGALTTRFEDYLRANLDERSRTMAGALGRAYEARGGWDQRMLMDLTHLAMSESLSLELKSPEGTVLWRTMGMGMGMMPRMPGMHEMPGTGGNLGGMASSSQDVKAGNRTVAVLTLRARGGPGVFSNLELAFLRGLNRSILISGLGVGALALVAGLLMASGVTRPLASVTDAARRIRSGDLSVRVGESGPEEVRELGSAVNHLAEGLATQEKLRRRLTADVAHELRTPLATMQSHLEAFSDGVWEATPERLAVCQSELLRLVRLVGDLERLAQAEAEPKLEIEEIAAREVVDRTAGAFQAAFAAKGVQLVLNPGDSGLKVRADRDKLAQILGNLVYNALKYTPPGGRVGIEARSDGARIIFEVSDTGPGIPEEELPFVFERFYRGDPSRTRLTGGAGLGLAIAMALARAHEGTIEVESQVDRGSRFRLILPA